VSEIAVDVRDVSKRFRLSHGKYNSLKERLIHAGQSSHEDSGPSSTCPSRCARARQWDPRPQRLGKSTLLKCICGVLQPTSGEVMVRGKLAGLLELGRRLPQD